MQVAVLIALVAVVKVCVTAQTELRSVEAYYWLYAKHPDLGYPDHPGMIAWLVALSTRFFGDGPLAVRSPSIACGALMAWFVFLAARRLYDARVARLAASMAAATPMFFLHAGEAAPDAPMLLFWSAAIWTLVRALTGAPAWWLATGALAGLAMNSKYNAVFLPLGILVFLAASPEHRCWLRRPWPWWGGLVALATFTPTLVWNAQNGWESMRYQSAGRLSEASGFSWRHVSEFPRDLVVELTPFLAAAGAWAAWRGIRGWRAAPWPDRLMVALGVPLVAVMFAVSFARSVRGYWAGPALVSLAMLAATQTGVAWRRLLTGTALALLAGLALLPVALSFVPVERRAGWSRFARRIDTDFVLARDYHHAAQLRYHGRDAWDFTPMEPRQAAFRRWWYPSRQSADATLVWRAKDWPRDLELVRAHFRGRLQDPVEVDLGWEKFVLVRTKRGWFYGGE